LVQHLNFLLQIAHEPIHVGKVDLHILSFSLSFENAFFFLPDDAIFLIYFADTIFIFNLDRHLAILKLLIQIHFLGDSSISLMDLILQIFNLLLHLLNFESIFFIFFFQLSLLCLNDCESSIL